MRLEDHDDAPVMPLPRRGERRGDLHRMMRVVVHHSHPRRLAAQLEPPTHAGEYGEPGRRDLGCDAAPVGEQDRAGGVVAVVASRHGEPQVHVAPAGEHQPVRVDAAIAVVAHDPHGTAGGVFGDTCLRAPVGSDDQEPLGGGNRPTNSPEDRFDLVDAGVGGVVVVVDVQQDRGLWREVEQGAVALVGLGHEPGPLPHTAPVPPPPGTVAPMHAEASPGRGRASRWWSTCRGRPRRPVPGGRP